MDIKNNILKYHNSFKKEEKSKEVRKYIGTFKRGRNTSSPPPPPYL